MPMRLQESASASAAVLPPPIQHLPLHPAADHKPDTIRATCRRARPPLRNRRRSRAADQDCGRPLHVASVVAAAWTARSADAGAMVYNTGVCTLPPSLHPLADWCASSKVSIETWPLYVAARASAAPGPSDGRHLDEDEGRSLWLVSVARDVFYTSTLRALIPSFTHVRASARAARISGAGLVRTRAKRKRQDKTKRRRDWKGHELTPQRSVPAPLEDARMRGGHSTEANPCGDVDEEDMQGGAGGVERMPLELFLPLCARKGAAHFTSREGRDARTKTR
ncbi:hypothetical protein FB451DRAFT_1519729 [Mycena latifolia]|nr:hypothetical protein FB451DRAFT_1519729 [Mycena latifolia]